MSLNQTFSKTPIMVKRPGLRSGWAIIRIILKITTNSFRIVKLQSEADSSFSRDEIVIKRTNAQISGMEHFKLTGSPKCKFYKPRRTSRKKFEQFQILLQVTN